MKDNYKTTLYVAELADKTVPTREDVRKELWKYMKQANSSGLLNYDDEKELISYNGKEIGYRVMDAITANAYLLAFRPYGKVAGWGKASVSSSQNVLDFCDLLGSVIQIPTNPELSFKRRVFAYNDRIDISEWTVLCPYDNLHKKTDLIKFRSSSNYESSLSAVPRNSEMHIFTDTYFKGAGPCQALRETLSVYGKVFGPYKIAQARMAASRISPRAKKDTIFVFLENDEGLDKYYETDKIFFDSNLTPTQYVSTGTVEEKLSRYQGVNANLILEMLTKMGRQPVVLQAPEEIFANDGFLCLSDIETVSDRLFGAIFTYAKQGLEMLREDVQIYDNIRFRIPNTYSIEIDDENIGLLADYVYGLVGGRNNIDILLTKRWKYESIIKLIDLLSRNNIRTKRVYYISSRTSRFVDEYLLDNRNFRSLIHPYLIINKKIAFLKACTEIRIFQNLFSLFVELQYPKQEELTQEDLEKLLWLAKKRIYRIQEFSMLKVPEPLYVFSNLRKIYIGKTGTRNTIPLRLLI